MNVLFFSAEFLGIHTERGRGEEKQVKSENETKNEMRIKRVRAKNTKLVRERM
jgi:hypothetical protein